MHVFRKRDDFISADVGMVFGNENERILRVRISHAVDLYHAKKLGRLLLTGGRSRRNRKAPKSESEMMSEIALRNDVLECDILMETESANTVENLARSAAILNCCMEFRKFSSIALISCPSHMGRVFMLAQRHFSNCEKLFCSHTDHGVSWEDTKQDPAIPRQVKKEMGWIRDLIKNGYELPSPNVE